MNQFKKIVQHKATKIFLSDGTYLIYGTMFAIQCSLYPASDAPANLSHFMKVLFNTISDMFNKKDNPDYFGYAIADFCVFGSLKLLLAVSNYQFPWLCASQLVQGLCIMLLAIVNPSVSQKAHLAFTYLAIFVSMAIGFQKAFQIKTPKLKQLGTQLLTLVYTSSLTTFVVFLLHEASAKNAVQNFWEFCKTAIGLSIGYHEWYGIMVVLLADWVINSESLKELVIWAQGKMKKKTQVE